MLQHEQEQPLETPAAPETPAARMRVTSEELASAINALEADREQQTRTLEGTVPIGQVVRELDLKATPEELWARIQVQRAQAAAPHAAARTRGRRTVWAWLLGAGLAWALIIMAAVGGLRQGRGGVEPPVVEPPVVVASAPHAPVAIHRPRADKTAATVSGDGAVMTENCRDTDLDVSGDGNNITVTGHCRSLTVGGNGDVVSVTGSVDEVRVTGDGNNVSWDAGQQDGPPTVSNEGDGNVLSAP